MQLTVALHNQIDLIAILVCIHNKEGIIMPKEYAPSFLIVHKMQSLNVLKGTAGKLSAAFGWVDPLRSEALIFSEGPISCAN